MLPVDVNTLYQAVGKLVENAELQGQFDNALATRVVEIERLLRERRSAVYVEDHLALTRVLRGFLMYADTRDLDVAPRLLLDGEWEPHITKLLLTIVKPGMTVVDAGANIGYFSLMAASATGPEGSVLAFEPLPRNFAILQRNVLANWYGDRIRCFPYALLDCPKDIQLHTSTCLPSGSSFFLTDLAGVNFNETIQVTAKTLDEIVETPVDVMKIDAEGSEPFIIEGMKGVLARSPQITIVMEFNPPALKAAGKDPMQFLNRLRELGFAAGVLNLQGVIEPLDEPVLLGEYIHTLVLSKN